MAIAPFGLQDLINSMAANYAAAAGLPADVGTGSQFGPMFRAYALALLLEQNETLYVESIARLATMQDPLPDGTPNPDVDAFINDFGFYRNGPSPSQIYVTAAIPSPVSQDTIVPVGLVLGTQGGPQFTVIAGGTGYSTEANGYVISAHSTSVPALTQCSVNGSSGNVLAATITQVITGPNDQPLQAPFSVTNPGAYNASGNTPGVDPESGQPLKIRFAAYMSGGGEGTVNSIIAAVLAVQTGLTISFGDLVMGVKSGGSWTFTPNTDSWFTVIVNLANQGGEPPSALLTAVQAAIINAVRSAGISFAVAPPTLVQVAGSGTVVVAPGYDPTATVAAVNAAFTTFVNGIGLDLYGNTTVCSIMATYVALAAVPGVLRIDNLLLNGGSADAQAAFGSQLTAGSAGFVP